MQVRPGKCQNSFTSVWADSGVAVYLKLQWLGEKRARAAGGRRSSFAQVYAVQRRTVASAKTAMQQSFCIKLLAMGIGCGSALPLRSASRVRTQQQWGLCKSRAGMASAEAAHLSAQQHERPVRWSSQPAVTSRPATGRWPVQGQLQRGCWRSQRVLQKSESSLHHRDCREHDEIPAGPWHGSQ